MHTAKSLKSQAKLLRAHLSDQNLTLTHSQALEAVAASHGFKSWRTAEALLPEDGEDSASLSADRGRLASAAVSEALRKLAGQQVQTVTESAENATAGQRLQSARFALNRPQKDFCELWEGVNLARLRQLEAGHAEPTAKELRSLLKAGVNPMWVVAGMEPMLIDLVAPMDIQDVKQQLRDNIDDLTKEQAAVLVSLEQSLSGSTVESVQTMKMKAELAGLLASAEQLKQVALKL